MTLDSSNTSGGSPRSRKRKRSGLALVVPIEDRRKYADTVQTLRKLLAQAERGEVRGLVFTVEYPSETRCGATGSLRRDLAKGVCAALDLYEAMRDLIRSPE